MWESTLNFNGLLYVVFLLFKFNEISNLLDKVFNYFEPLCQRMECMELHKLDRVLIHRHTAGSGRIYDYI